jgi:hypothetical protein
MAKLTDAQVAQIIAMSGGDTEILTSAGISTPQIIRALVSSPQILSSLQKKAAKEVTGYGRFYKNKVYDPAYTLNDVEAKYTNMDPAVTKFAQDFWKQIKEQGSDTTTFTYIKDTYDKNKDAVMGNFNLTQDQYDDAIALFDADINDFRKAEVARQKLQYKAYNTKRKAMGITSRETASKDYLTTKTGIYGLGDVPTSAEDYAKREAESFAKFAREQGLKDEQISSLTPMLQDAIKKKVGKNYKNYAMQDLLKRQIAGE